MGLVSETPEKKHTLQWNKSEMNATMLDSISILPDEHLLYAPSSLLLQTH